ncbi:sodium/proline symporter PutP [Corynebacterium liangguodongii]|uniref:Sodium/proline symporter n=1 Tax=Corynebacterium liangguodongii TaxID=2079535 RepID=A0A2S0WGZ9_9CORY|nr:sodium/proline symporter PutP [Corynebacterium liangguodongii]AWB85043.1 sodium/proline symporter PutP [Corynebacterium liangguodongii]PWB98991.1 sodium/proline symporter PutP [Corynebacterium liangguodongii]
MITAIVLYFAVMLAIGYYSWRKTSKYDDYVLGGRDLPPFVAAISAGASDMSGWLLMGLPGALFATGMSELWIMIGLLMGTWANWKWVAPRLRSFSEVSGDSITLPSFFENRTHDTSRVLRVVAAVIIIFFFTFYVSSGMVAGGKYYESTFGGNYLTGMLIVGAVTVIYTLIGGFLAVSYTDVVQGMLMFAALLAVPITALFVLNNPADIFSFAAENPYGPYPEANPTYFNLFAGVSAVTIIGNLAWGLGYMGQPHIVTRFMALRSPAEAASARRTGTTWVSVCYIGAVFTALVGTVYFSQTGAQITDASGETVFLDLAKLLFHPLIAGIILTAVLAAIMSTMSSQLLITSSALIEDLYRVVAKREVSGRWLLLASRGMVVAIALIAVALAVNPSDTVLGLVGFAWAGFGAAFGPVVVASLYWKRLTAPGAIAAMLSGAVTVFVWGSIDSALTELYEIVPGVIVATVAMVAVSLATRAKPEAIEQFNAAVRVNDYAMDNPTASFDDALDAVEGRNR